jgi:hypothetical protein
VKAQQRGLTLAGQPPHISQPEVISNINELNVVIVISKERGTHILLVWAKLRNAKLRI